MGLVSRKLNKYAAEDQIIRVGEEINFRWTL